MGRRLSSLYNPVLAIHAPARSTGVCPDAALHPPLFDLEQPADTTGALAIEAEDAVMRPLKWRDAPFDIDEERDDAVYEAFVSPDGSMLPSPTVGQLGSSLPLSTPLDNDAPSPLDFSDCLDGPPGPSDDPNFLHPNTMISQPPMTPSSAVFHTMTLPLMLPAPHERLGSRRANSSTNVSVSSSLSTNMVNAEQSSPGRHRLAPPPSISTGSTLASATNNSTTSPIQFSLPPAPRWTHRQPPPATASSNLSRLTSRPWEAEEINSALGELDARRSLIQAEFSRLLEQLRTTHGNI